MRTPLLAAGPLVLALGLAAGLVTACAGAPHLADTPSAPSAPHGFDAEAALETVRVLSADDMQGRRTDTEGGARARAWLLQRLADMRLPPAGASYEQPFEFTRRRRRSEASAPDAPPIHGVNLVARLDGAAPGQGPVLVVTAHYDHMGVRDGEIYNGADDNASGVAALLAIAERFTAEPPRHDVVFALLDAEELGLRGARAFVDDPPVARERIAVNLNLDMIGKSDRGELYAAGAFHTPALGPLLDEVAGRAPITLIQGHDDPALRWNDWTYQSDHGRFHDAGIPFVYLGVEDHAEYHEPTDVFETMPQEFFLGAVETAARVARALDDDLEAIAASAVAAPEP